jgi:hypothetical protein
MALPLAMPQRVRIGRRSQLRLEIQGCDGAPVILLSHYQLCVVSLYMMHCNVLYVSFIENVHLRMPFVSELGLGFWCRKTTLSCVIFLSLFPLRHRTYRELLADFNRSLHGKSIQNPRQREIATKCIWVPYRQLFHRYFEAA